MEMPRESLLAIRCNPSEMIAGDANLFEIPQICCVRASAFNENVLKGAMSPKHMLGYGNSRPVKGQGHPF